jgi:hypothetical protein
MGLQVNGLLGEEEIKKKAEARKTESDQILEMVYDKLVKGVKKREENN